MTIHKNSRHTYVAALSAVVASIMAGGLAAQAQDTSKLEQENQELRKRLDDMEALLEKEGLKPSGTMGTAQPVKALTDVTISGFVTSSYFYDLASPRDNHPTGYLWNTSMNSFEVNKIKLTLASPGVDKDKWSAAYRASFIWGADAPFVDTGSTDTAGFSWLREAYVELNVPIGTGLDIRAGQLISLLNYESGDGGAANGNFSQGYQWWYTGNGPDAGVQLGYDFNDFIGIKVREQNGLYNGAVSTGAKTFLGGLYINPDKKTSIAILGFEGRQDSAYTTPPFLDGGSVIASRKITENHNINVAIEADYFNFSHAYAFVGSPDEKSHGDWWSLGAWLSADLVPKLGATVRVDYVTDPTGFGTEINSPNPAVINTSAGSGFPAGVYGSGQNLMSATLTLDYMPAPQIKIQPEIRWNHSSYSGAFATANRDQFIIGMGATYMF